VPSPHVGGRLFPLLREMGEMGYIFDRPYVMRSNVTQDELGLTPTAWDEVCRRTAEGN